jgi:dihydrodipicolinate reductase
VAAVSRTKAGRRLGDVLGDTRITSPIYASATEALACRCDVFVEYTKPDTAIFGMPDQRLTIRHDSGNSARPYVDGALIAIRHVSTLVGVHRGLDTVLDL